MYRQPVIQKSADKNRHNPYRQYIPMSQHGERMIHDPASVGRNAPEPSNYYPKYKHNA
jgi:hypothetical protein